MLPAVSKVDLRKWQNPMDALAQGLKVGREDISVMPTLDLDIEAAELTAGQDLDYLGSMLSQQLAGDESFAGGSAQAQGDVAGRVDLVVRLDAAEER